MSKHECLWFTTVGDYEVGVYSLPSGKFLASYGLKSNLCRAGDRSSTKEDVFDNVDDAYRFVGFPVGILPLPHLKEENK